MLFRLLSITCILALSLSTRCYAQDPIQDIVAGWDFLSTHVKAEASSETNDANGKKYTASASAFGQKVTIELNRLPDSKLNQFALIFPKGAQLTLEHMKQLAGQDLKSIVPPSLGAGLSLDRLELDVAGKKITRAAVVMTMSTWLPFGDNTVQISGITSKFAVLNPTSAKKNIAVDITGRLNLPKDLASYLNMGATELNVRGAVNTKTKRLSLAADLTSERIPIGNQEIIYFRNAFVEFFMEGPVPGIAVGGQVEIDPPDQDPILLDGEMAIDVKGELFGQAWMTGDWHNPFDISNQVYVTKLGLGFGVDFGKPPFPLPILAFEGGLAVGNPDPKHQAYKFGGKVTIGMHAGDPTQNMIHATEINAKLYDLVETFYPKGVPQEISTVLRDFELKEGRLTIVPAGNGVELFGKHYEPGIHIQGKTKAGDLSGKIYISISEDAVTGYGTISSISLPGVSITNASGAGDPEVYLNIQQGQSGIKGSSLIIDGKIDVLGISQAVKVYFSDEGFELDVNGKILNAFNGNLNVAGADLLGDGGVFVNASFENSLFTKINEVAADEIGKTAKQVNKDMSDAQAGLKLYEPQYEAAKREYEAIKAVVQAENTEKCKKLDNLKAQKKAQEDQKAALNARISAVEIEIRGLKSKIDNGFKPATFIKRTTCSNVSQYDPRNGGECWQCPSGFDRNLLIPVNQSRACVKPAYKVFTKANYHGRGSGLLGTDCGSGQFFDAIDGGGCWSIPAGYQRENLTAINRPNACSKVIPESFASSNFLGSLACTGQGQFVDLRNGGECWSCQSGYTRPVTTVPVTGQKACERTDMAQLRIDLGLKETDRLAMIADRDLIVGKLGDLGQLMTAELQKACDAMANSELVNADPRVAPKFAKFTELWTLVKGYNEVLEGIKNLSVGTLKAAEYVVRNAGSTTNIVNITSASFQGCASVTKDGYVALKVKGTYCDDPIDVSFDINLKSPDEMIRTFADALMKTNTSASTRNNGTCTKPVVPRPNFNNAELSAFLGEAQNVKELDSDRPEKKERPTWAGPQRFEDGNFVDQMTLALTNGDASKMVELAGYGIDLNVKDQNQATPLMWAAQKAGVSEVITLVSQGADPTLKGAIYLDKSRKESFGSLMAIAGYKGDLDMLIYLVEGLGLSVDDREYDPKTKQNNGMTAMERAASKGESRCATYLIDQGASPANNDRAVLKACESGNFDLAIDLLSKGYKGNASNSEGLQALHFAAEANNVKAVQSLLEAGANKNAVSKSGWTPLIKAAYNGKTEASKLLVAAGADRSKVYQKKDAAKWAKKNGFKDLGKYIKKPQ